jgi:hypothetical protein
MKRVSDDDEIRDQSSNLKETFTIRNDEGKHHQKRTIIKDFRLNNIRTDEDWSSNQVKHNDMDIPPMEDNYMSQLTMDSQYMNTDDNEQLSQESTNGIMQIQKEQTSENDTQTNQDDNKLTSTERQATAAYVLVRRAIQEKKQKHLSECQTSKDTRHNTMGARSVEEYELPHSYYTPSSTGSQRQRCAGLPKQNAYLHLRRGHQHH